MYDTPVVVFVLDVEKPVDSGLLGLVGLFGFDANGGCCCDPITGNGDEFVDDDEVDPGNGTACNALVLNGV